MPVRRLGGCVVDALCSRLVLALHFACSVSCLPHPVLAQPCMLAWTCFQQQARQFDLRMQCNTLSHMLIGRLHPCFPLHALPPLAAPTLSAGAATPWTAPMPTARRTCESARRSEWWLKGMEAVA